jgi:hypothetical protein
VLFLPPSPASLLDLVSTDRGIPRINPSPQADSLVYIHKVNYNYPHYSSKMQNHASLFSPAKVKDCSYESPTSPSSYPRTCQAASKTRLPS